MNCAIIGAGQLGSRHLQGLLSVASKQLNISVVDPSDESLKIAEIRANELAHGHNLNFLKELKDLPKNLDFVVVATNSSVRLNVIEALLNTSKVSFLILEKVLFTKIEHYGQAISLINKFNVKCWVNHPRRMYTDYSKLKELIDPQKTYNFQLLGGAWGLACNGLHFIDLFEFLTDSSLSSLSTDLLTGNPIQSKRQGYIEFEGTISGTIGLSHSFSISSLHTDSLVAPSISIMTDDLRIFIQESATPKIYLFKLENQFKLEELSFQIMFQSQLTGRLFEQIVSSGTCQLPTLNHASNAHKIFIASILNKWNSTSNQNNDILPIT